MFISSRALPVWRRLNIVALQFISGRTISNHQHWRRAFLKDLYNRRVMLGPDPIVSRSAQDDWNYSSEISALSHRLRAHEIDHDLIVQALTNESFFERKDVDEGAANAQPSNEEQITNNENNRELAEKGASIFHHILLVYLRAHWQMAPEEFIIECANRMASFENLTELGNHLGLQHLVRTGEFPPNESTLHAALFSLIAIMDSAKARDFVRVFVLPQLHSVPLEDVLPFKYPFQILKDYMRKWRKVEDLEPRFINSGGLSTSTPYCEIAIYANKSEIIGQSFGEFPWVALDLASQNALLKLWKVMEEAPRIFPFKFDEIYSSRFERARSPNHSLKEVCNESTDTSLYTMEELMRDPIDPIQMARTYQRDVKSQVGFPHRKRLRHMFHRGTVQRYTLRRLVKPEPHNI